MGPVAVLVDDPPGGPAAWAAGLSALGVPDVIDVVPAASTVMVRVASPAALAAIVESFGDVDPVRGDPRRRAVEIPVRYDGPDLEDVAAASRMSVDEVVTLHSGASYEVAFCGFAPGFGYLSGLPERLHLPRRTTPRTSVPAGSVAIAAGFSAVYPRASPGGWHLLGATEAVLFDVTAEVPVLLTPGTTVRFVVA